MSATKQFKIACVVAGSRRAGSNLPVLVRGGLSSAEPDVHIIARLAGMTRLTIRLRMSFILIIVN
jgi:hypothetical protein